MNTFLIRISLLVFVCNQFHVLSAQEPSSTNTLSKDYKKEVVNVLSMHITNEYIYPDVGKKTVEKLKAELDAGSFDGYTDDATFAQALTECVQSVNKDKHMKVRANPPYEAPPNTVERKTEERMDQINNYRGFNHGFTELKILEGNVAYLDLRGFAGMERAKVIADAYMKLMSLADAVIIDVSKNGGGSPRMVQYLCSHFFDEKLHLNSLHYRRNNHVEEFWTLDEVDGKKMPDVPLFVITGEDTFSGAEEFSYNMQTQKRATLIGQKTGGGANPGRGMGLNENLSVFIPTGRAVNPITNTSWEGVGVIPEVKTSVEETFDKAYKMAIEAAEKFRFDKSESYKRQYVNLESVLASYVAGESDKLLENTIRDFINSGLFGEWDINTMGYDYLLKKEKPNAALGLFKLNTLLHPDSPNVFDSYGEALMHVGDIQEAVRSYQGAVDVAKRNEDLDLEFYQGNLEMAKDKLKGNK